MGLNIEERSAVVSYRYLTQKRQNCEIDNQIKNM